MIDLPEGLQSSILSRYCDGKSIAIFFEVLFSSNTLRQLAFDLTRDALVDRYTHLAEFEYSNYEEIRDVLDVIREEIRMCRIIQDANGQMSGDEGQVTFRESVAKKISDWCAIIEYFDIMKSQRGERSGEFVLWCGELKTQQGFGTIQKAALSSALWTVTSMDYLHDQLELSNHYLTHPAIDNLPPSVLEAPYGVLDVESEEDYDVLQRIQYSLRSNPDSARFFLVPSQMEYELTLGFALNQDLVKRKGLIFHWDGNDEGDFEYSLTRLAENVRRILQRL